MMEDQINFISSINLLLIYAKNHAHLCIMALEFYVSLCFDWCLNDVEINEINFG